jgi:drug/metabolite transporter (DMT)-like permease
MQDRSGVLIAVLSSGLGSSAAAVTKYLVDDADATTIAVLRWGISFAFLLPIALLFRAKWPPREDWFGVAGLGIMFFGLFFIFYNVAVSYTTAARASLALSTLPLQTMVVGAILGIEALSFRKSLGVLIAILGVFAALATGLANAPEGAWKGELIMIGAVLCMAFYNVWSRPFMQRSSALGFLTLGMGAGAGVLVMLSLTTGGIWAIAEFGRNEWLAGIYLGIGGGAFAFIFWVLALQRTTPTRVANTMTVNPVVAALLATQLVGEPFTMNLVFGLVGVFLGIWVATTEPRNRESCTANVHLTIAPLMRLPFLTIFRLPFVVCLNVGCTAQSCK